MSVQRSVRPVAIEREPSGERPDGLADFCRTLLKANPDCVFVLNGDDQIEFTSENGARHLGLKDARLLIGADWTVLWPASEQGKVTEAIEHARTGETAHFEALRPTAAGDQQYWSVTISALANSAHRRGNHAALLCVARDVTVTRRAMEQTGRSLRLEAVAQLTGGLAHDFNNLLTVIIGATEALTDTLAGDSQERELAVVSLRAAERGAEQVRRLLSLCRQQPVTPQRVACAEVVEGVRPFLQRLVRGDIALDIDSSTRPLHCVADASALEAALINLVVNARDAIKGAGRIGVKVDTVSLTGRYADRVAMAAGSYVIFTVTDTGCGMSPVTIRQAVEPFYTEKAGAGGSGLGLSTTFEFARQAGGHLAISSEVGVGTSVSLYLPRAEVSTVAAAVPLHAARACAERVLLVEPDALVRAQVCRLLRDLGYAVGAVGDAAAALAAVDRGEHIDLLIAEVEALDGAGLARRITAVRPGVRVLFTGGATTIDPSAPLLAKPFRRAQLAAAVAAVLADASVKRAVDDPDALLFNPA